MTTRFFSRNAIRNSTVSRPVSAQVFGWLAMLAVIGSIICCGFFVSAHQHFEAIKLGYERESLRQEGVGLEKKLRKLEMDKELATSKDELARRATLEGLARPVVPDIKRPGSGKTAVR